MKYFFPFFIYFNFVFLLYPNQISEIEKKYNLKSLNIQGFVSIISRNEKKLEEILKKIKNIDKNSLEYSYIRGAKFFASKNYYQSEIELLKSIKIDRNHSPSYYLLGILYAHRNDWQSAKDNFALAVQISKYDPFYRLNLALSYFQSGNLSESINQSLKVLEIKPNYKEAIILLAKSYYILGDKKKSLRLCQKLETMNYNSYDFSVLYSKLLFHELKHYSKVIILLDKIKNLYYPEMILLAKSYLETNNFKLASNLYKNITKNNLSSEEDKINYIKSMVFSNKIKEMENYTKKIIEQNPTKEEYILQKINFFKNEKQTIRMMHQIIPQKESFK